MVEWWAGRTFQGQGGGEEPPIAQGGSRVNEQSGPLGDLLHQKEIDTGQEFRST